MSKSEELISIVEKVKSFWKTFNITEGLLKNPTQAFVYSMYLNFHVERQKKMNEIMTAVFHKEPELDQTVMDEFSLAVALNKLGKQLKLPPFYLNDIYEPQPKRTQLFMKAFINYLIFIHSSEYKNDLDMDLQPFKYYQASYMERQSLMNESKELVVLNDKSEESIKSLTESINNLSEEHEHVMRIKAERLQKNQENVNIVKELKKRNDEKDEIIEKLSKDLVAYNNEVVEKSDVDSIVEKIKDIESEEEKININLTELVPILDNQEGKNRHVSECLEALKSFNLSLEYLNVLTTLLDNEEEIIMKIKRAKDEISDKKVEINVFKRENADLEAVCSKIDNELPNLIIHIERKSKDLQQKLELRQQDLIVADELEAFMEEVNEEISKVSNDSTLLEDFVIHEYRKLLHFWEKGYNNFNEVQMKLKKDH